MRLAVSVTVTQIGEDGSTRAVGGELAAAPAGPVEQFTGMLTWTAEQAGAADHGDREKVIAESGLELQRRLLEFSLRTAENSDPSVTIGSGNPRWHSVRGLVRP